MSFIQKLYTRPTRNPQRNLKPMARRVTPTRECNHVRATKLKSTGALYHLLSVNRPLVRKIK